MHSRAIDWEAIHRRLAVAAEGLSRQFASDPEARRRILAERARAAASPPEQPDDAERFELLDFSLAAERYGVETRHVREVCQLRDLTPLPCTPQFVAGVMNLRGHVLAIIDLRKFFQLPAPGLTELSRVIVLEGDGHRFGLLADSIDGIGSVSAVELRPGPTTPTGIRESFLRGVTDQMLAVLDGGRLLASPSLKVDQRTTGKAR